MCAQFSVVFFMYCPAVERSSAELQWLLNMVQNDPAHYARSAKSQQLVLYLIACCTNVCSVLSYYIMHLHLHETSNAAIVIFLFVS